MPIYLNWIVAAPSTIPIRRESIISDQRRQEVFSADTGNQDVDTWQLGIDQPVMKGSMYPVAGSLADGFVELELSYTLPVDLADLDVWSQASLQFSLDNGKTTKTANWTRETKHYEANQLVIKVLFRPSYEAPNFPWGFAGDVIWTLTINDQSCVQTTMLELYCLTDTLPSFFHGVVDVSFLRAMVLPARSAESPTPGSWTDYVVNACFSKFGFKYDDINSGASKFADSGTGGSYDLRRWARFVNWAQSVNCYDQAGIVMIALGLGPKVKAEWVYLSPFGFIGIPPDLTHLPDHPCNSPFAGTEDKLCVGNEDGDRTWFRNHAFVRVGDKIYDACAGPTLGVADIDAYVSGTIQGNGPDPKQTTLYSGISDVDHQKPGTSANALYCGDGVTSVDECDIRPPRRDKPATENSDKVMKMAEATRPDITVYAIDITVAQETILDQLRQNGYSWDDWNSEVYVNSQGLEATWDFCKRGEIAVEINLQVCQSHDRAAKMFENDIHNNSVPYSKNLEKPRNTNIYTTGTLQQLMIASKTITKTPTNQMVLWVRGNLNISIKGPATSADALWQLVGGTALDRAFGGHTITGLGVLDPSNAVTISPSTPEPSSVVCGFGIILSFTLSFECAYYSCTDLNYEAEDQATKSDLIFVTSTRQDDDRNITFNLRGAKQPRTHVLEFAFAETSTARVVSKTVKIEMVADSN